MTNAVKKVDKLTYKNKYGELKLEIMSELQPIGYFRIALSPDDCKFTLDDAEKIALITGNKYTQICIGVDLSQGCILILHESNSHGYLCKPDLSYTSAIIPADELHKVTQSSN